jgi:hypothetical protein
MAQNHPQKECSGVVNKLIILSVEPAPGPKPSTTSSRHGLQETSPWNQLKVLLRRGYIKTKRDQVCISIFYTYKYSISLVFCMLYNCCIGAKFDPVQYKFDLDAKPLQLA